MDGRVASPPREPCIGRRARQRANKGVKDPDKHCDVSKHRAGTDDGCGGFFIESVGGGLSGEVKLS